MTAAAVVLVTTEGGPLVVTIAEWRRARRVPMRWATVESHRVWQLAAFGRAEHRRDLGFQMYLCHFLVTAWSPAQRILRPWRRWPPWMKIPSWVNLETLPRTGRLPPGCGFWHVGYQSHRGPRRSRRHRRVRGHPPLTG